MLSTSLSGLAIVGALGLVYLAIAKILQARRIMYFHNETDLE